MESPVGQPGGKFSQELLESSTGSKRLETVNSVVFCVAALAQRVLIHRIDEVAQSGVTPKSGPQFLWHPPGCLRFRGAIVPVPEIEHGTEGNDVGSS